MKTENYLGGVPLIKNLSASIADFYVQKNIINSDEKEVYQWGVSLVLNDIVTFSLVLLLSALLSHVRFGAEYLIVFCLTRIYCGGYHARKESICRFTMIVVFLIVLFGAHILSDCSRYILLSVLTVSFMVLLPLIPVRHPNKVMTEKLKKKGRVRGTLSYLAFAVLSLLFYLFVSKIDAVLIALSLSAVSVLAIIGTFTNERRVNK